MRAVLTAGGQEAVNLSGAIREHMGSARYRLSWWERVGTPYPFRSEMSVQIKG